MTMDNRVFKAHHQHEFQQQQALAQPQLPKQQQCSAQHSLQAHRLYPTNSGNTNNNDNTNVISDHVNNNNQLLLHHQTRHHHNTQTQISNTNAPSTLHRPIHPPPPPPAPPSSQLPHPPPSQRILTANSETVNHIQPNVANPIAPVAATNLRSVGPIDYLQNPRNSNHSYHVNSHYQLYQPSNLQTYFNSSQQHNQHDQAKYPDIPQDEFRSQQSYSVTDSSVNNDNYIINHDHFTEEVIQAILSAKDALEKPIEERDERDILLIDNLCSLVHGFDAFPKTVRRALAAQAVLIVIDEKGKELIVHNEELDSFCVLIFGECEQLNVAKTVPIRYYNVGDSFGVCEPTTETIRFVGHMITRCENCAFLCVKRDDFYTILTDPANYPNKEVIRHRDKNGNVICVSEFKPEKKSSGPLWSNHTNNNNPFKIVLPDGHIITKVSILY